MILIHGFAKVTNDPILQSAGPDVVIWVSCHEDRRNLMPPFDEASMEVESGHRGHVDVGNQAGGFDKARGCEEIRGGSEGLDSVAK
jgi:hypothetical protein